MKKVIGRKQTSKNSEWLHALANIESIVTEDEVDAAIDKAVNDVLHVTSGKKVAYGWSGGKDATALRHVCELAGIKASFFGRSELDFPAFAQWCKENMPENCEIIDTLRTYYFLAAHPEALFPNHKDREPGDLMLRTGPQYTFQKWFDLHPETDFILVGHRTIDGNVTGKNKFLANKKGMVRYSPIADWTHELVLGLVYYKGYEFAPNYWYPNGFVNGTHCWNDTVGIETIPEGWEYVWNIDKSIVEKAMQYNIQGAKEHIERWLKSRIE